MYAILKALYDTGFDGYIRPDHGRMIWGETGRPGYGLYDRALGAAYINGLWEAITKADGGGYNGGSGNNVRIDQFPDAIIAHIFHFEAKPLLEFSSAEKSDVNLKQLFS